MSEPSYRCPLCEKVFNRGNNRNAHVKKDHPNALFTCPMCSRQFPRLDKLKLHLYSHSSEPPSSLDSLPPPVKDIYLEHWGSVRDCSRVGSFVETHNLFWDPTVDTPPFREKLILIFNSQKFKFKINYSHSFLLQNKTSQQFKFFHSSINNHRVLPNPTLIRNKEEFIDFISDFENGDLLEHVRLQKPDSKFSVQGIMATCFYIYPLRFPIGCCRVKIPETTLENKHVNCLTHDDKTGKDYSDNLCFFRCLALQKGAHLKNLNPLTEELYHRWSDTPISHFKGVDLTDLPQLEEKFSVNIRVYAFQDPFHRPDSLVVVRENENKHTSTMKVLHYKNHFMFIKDSDKLGGCFECELCHNMFPTNDGLYSHKRYCQGKTNTTQYVGGVYTPPESVIHKLNRYNIQVDPDYVFPYRATYDFEAYFEKPTKKSTTDTVFTSKHVPLSVAICSNVPGHTEPVCFVNDGDTQKMISNMIDCLESVSKTSYNLLRENFENVFVELDARIAAKCPYTPATALKEEFDKYLKQFIVVGFNSSRYDINLTKPYLIEELVKRELEFVIKKNNQYICLSTPTLKFLDIMQFLAPGFSYAKYLRAFNVQEPKGFFCYEYITSLTKLKEKKLPPHVAFYSQLKKSNISAEEYAFCQDTWKSFNMSSLKDFLIWYNLKDVVPFLEALQNQIDMYKGLGVDLLKDGVSVPGITLKYLFKNLPSNVYFSLFGQRHSDLHELLRENIVGGPSLIFHRLHKKDETFIRHNPTKPTQSVLGYDANALYLSCLMQNMPTEHPIIRRREHNFNPEYIDKFGKQAREWLEWEAYNSGCKIRHKFNGKEQVLGPRHIRVDGWNGEMAFQFQGCLFHGHDCHITAGLTVNPINGRLLSELKEETRKISDHLKNELNIPLREMYECEWRRLKRTNSVIATFVNEHLGFRPCFFPTPVVTETSILDAVKNDKIFGLVRCDIRVPEHLKQHFEELQPIFKNTLVSRDDIGEHMKQYATEHKMLTQPRKTLVASYFANNIVLITPLLKWYMEHGLVVSNISIVLEYCPKPCFKEFGERVSEARRSGDSDPSKHIVAETFKLLGNSAYGKTITNVATHRDTFYSKDKDDIARKVANPKFKKLVELNDGLVELELGKKTVVWALPLQIGFFVYQYAKLRMLEFYYDFLDRFVSRTDFQLLEMDTDSLYIALSHESLDRAVKPEKKREYFECFREWFPSPHCEEHFSNFVTTRLEDRDDWTPCTYCLQRLKYDKRTPGLFKIEYTGDSFVGLCSKTYFCDGEGGNKFSSKGLNKNHNELSFHSYQRVLDTKTSGGGLNVGFRTDGQCVFTYFQKRKSLSYFYIKRLVCQDGVSTLPTLV